MKWIKTIRTRFALWATALILAFLTAFGGFVYFNLSLSLHTAIDDSLSLSASQTAADLNINNGQILPLEGITPEETDSNVFSQRGLTLIVLARDGSVLQATGIYSKFRLTQLTSDPQGSFLSLPTSAGGDTVRIYVLPVFDNNQVVGWVQVMQSLGGVQDSLDRLLVALLLGGGILTLLAGFAGYLLAARALSPIDDITQAVRRISTEDLSARLNLPDTGDEISRLATTFDEMLTRIESGFKRERQFTGDASHELRTPLAAMQAILSVMREGERPIPEYRQALDDLADETNRLRGLVEDLLHLARGDQPRTAPREQVDLSALLCDVTDSLRPLADAKGLSLNSDVSPGLVLMGDSDSLIRLFVNLLDNSIKFTECGAVMVTGRSNLDMLVVEIADTGSGIAPDHLERIFDRFYRVETASLSSGTGLGLAIARQIVQAHGGRIAVKSVLGQGTIINVQLPKLRNR
jgi:heavy metal sensor kinase